MDSSESLSPLTEPPGSRGDPRTDEISVATPLRPDREHDSLRIQAAAVAAQQASLVEEESRLQQQFTALQHQETQLASHLAARQHQLDEAEEQLRQDRAAFKQHCADRLAELDRRHSDLDQVCVATEQDRQKAARDRQRVSQLRRRLRQRWRRHFDAHECNLSRREQELLCQQQRLQDERAKVAAFQERINGERELARVQLREEWQQLGLAQQHWDETLNLEMAERQHRQKVLETRQASVEKAQRELSDHEQRWHAHCARLTKESQGLEERIRNQRATLETLQRDSARLQANQPGLPPASPLPLSPPVTPAVSPDPMPADVQSLAGTLDDQRRHLTEQWDRLLRVQETWQHERESALAEMETSAQHLGEREAELHACECVIEEARQENERRRDELARLREALEGWQARLTTQESNWQAQRAMLLAEVDSRERLLRLRMEQLEEVHRRRNRRRQQEVAEFQAARGRCEEARRQYGQLWHECEQLRAALAQQERTLSGRALALERFRQETIAQAPHSARAESRLDRLARRDLARLEAESRDLETERRTLQKERTRLDEQAAQLGKLEEELLRRQHDYTVSLADWEKRRTTAEQEDHLREEEIRRLQALHALSERQLRAAREEIERIARAMIEEGDGPAQAA
jgi:chromosome segregation ATPase